MSKQNIGIEEIQKIMQENNLSFSDIAKIAAGMNNGIITEKEKPVTKETSYEISSASYPDFTVTKTTTTQTKILVIAPSCNGYFIKTKTRNKDWEIEQLNEKNYANFAKDIKEPIEFEDNFWLKNLPSGEQGYFTIMRYLETDGIMEMLKDKCAPKYIKEYFMDNRTYYGSTENDIKVQVKYYKAFPILYKEYFNDTNYKISNMVRYHPELLYTIYKRFGLEKARDFVETAKLALISPWNGSYYSGSSGNIFVQDAEHYTQSKFHLIHKNERGEDVEYIGFYPSSSQIPYMEMDYEHFKEYYFFESYRMGYECVHDMLRDWNDDLKQQKTIYGKIKEKYPLNLQTHHARLSRIERQMRETIERKGFDAQAIVAKEYEWKMDKDEGNYIFIAPTVPEDFYNEARNQANCLAGYVSRFAKGDDIIMFMRDKEQPEASLVTIEIIGDTITQALRRSNRYPLFEQVQALKKFAKKFKLKYKEPREYEGV
jgi:hypothetical protein